DKLPQHLENFCPPISLSLSLSRSQAYQCSQFFAFSIFFCQNFSFVLLCSTCLEEALVKEKIWALISQNESSVVPISVVITQLKIVL
ncbi:hypothetical protein VIGAN_06085900, partial [Vigna angularis var. angularis]